MQTLHLRFRNLRAISLRQSLSRWPTPSAAKRGGMGGAFALPNPPEPTSAVGSRPAMSHQHIDRCPAEGAGLLLASPLREVSRCSAAALPRYQVCRRQTASDLSPNPAPHKAGDWGAVRWLAQASEVACSRARPFPERSPRSSLNPSAGLSFPLAHVKAWAGGSSHARDGCSLHRRGEGAWPVTTSP